MRSITAVTTVRETTVSTWSCTMPSIPRLANDTSVFIPSSFREAISTAPCGGTRCMKTEDLNIYLGPVAQVNRRRVVAKRPVISQPYPRTVFPVNANNVQFVLCQIPPTIWEIGDEDKRINREGLDPRNDVFDSFLWTGV